MLSGNSHTNRKWIYDVKDQFADMFDSIYVQDYRHWETGEGWIDLEHELSVLKEQTQNLQEPYGIFAKSIGTVLAVQAVRQGVLKPDFLLFCGVPLNFIIENNFQFFNELKACSLPTTLVHNEHDVVGSAADLKRYLGDELGSKVIVTAGNTHNYEDYALLRAEVNQLMRTT